MKAEQFSMNVILARSNSVLDAGRMHALGGFSIPLRFERMGIGKPRHESGIWNVLIGRAREKEKEIEQERKKE